MALTTRTRKIFTYLLLPTIITSPLHTRLMSLLRSRWTAQTRLLPIRHGGDGAPLPLARRHIIPRRRACRRCLLRRGICGSGGIERGAARPRHPVCSRGQMISRSPVSGGTVLMLETKSLCCDFRAPRITCGIGEVRRNLANEVSPVCAICKLCL